MTDLFNDFEGVSSKAWKQKIQVDLKGADYNETLIWNSNEGIDVKPFYHSDDHGSVISKLPKETSEVNICQSIYVNDSEKANAKAIDAINKGATALIFKIPSEEIDLKKLLQDLDLSSIPIYFQFQYLSADLIKSLQLLASVSTMRLNIDLIGNLARSGNWFHNLKQDHQLLEEIMKKSSSFHSALSVDMSLYQNAGANMVQQLAYGMAHANEYLNHFQNRLDQPIVFNVAIGTNYFFEIAKLRALRTLWSTLASEYEAETRCDIVVRPTKRNKTIYDYNTNLLRTTTECMSAIVGGADSICNLPYDAIYHKDNEFGERIARNQLLILKHESYFDLVNNPSDGAYYIESLTNEMAQKALELFKDIESNNGFLSQLKNGTIQRKIKESASREQQQFDDGKKVLLGTNKHPNAKDVMTNELELYPFVKINKRKTLIEPIIEKRLAESMEQERLKSE
ncbi:MAG: methylmalonyl-CoA mutase [Flavobacteriaceae bacterium]|nr:methylmalonyl-CoA mutase [Flavobacteriaceae bacterium]